MQTEQDETSTRAILADEATSRRERARTSLVDRLSRPSPTIWLSGQEAAEYVGVSWPTLRQAIIEFGIPHVRLGTCWRIEVAVLDEHLRRMARA
jgi:excisionase family DNA binding protein